jgi:RNA polymerase sigma factor (sigma-70 family)
VAFVRRGDPAAFEALYRRHAGELLSFCVYVLGSRQDAEDAVQATFAAAYRALLAHERPVALRPWLFTIARNGCLSILRKRRPTVELNGEPALGGDPFRELELREEIRHMVDGLRQLPERQRSALVLAELHGLSQVEIGSVLGVRAEQVKAYVYQARSHLISERHARETDCGEIREELATARGGALLRGRLRRHVRSCADCRVYANGVAHQRRELGALLPVAPSLALKYSVLEHALGLRSLAPATYGRGAAVGGSLTGAAVEFASGGVKGLLVKVGVGAACVSASACVGASVLSIPTSSESQRAAPAPAMAASGLKLSASLGRAGKLPTAGENPALNGRAQGQGAEAGRGRAQRQAPVATAPQDARARDGGGRRRVGFSVVGETPAEDNGRSAERQRKSEQRQHEREQRREDARTASREREDHGRTRSEQRQHEREQRVRERERERSAASGPPEKGREGRQREREESPRSGASGPPKEIREERQREHAERRRERRQPPR